MSFWGIQFSLQPPPRPLSDHAIGSLTAWHHLGFREKRQHQPVLFRPVFGSSGSFFQNPLLIKTSHRPVQILGEGRQSLPPYVRSGTQAQGGETLLGATSGVCSSQRPNTTSDCSDPGRRERICRSSLKGVLAFFVPVPDFSQNSPWAPTELPKAISGA